MISRAVTRTLASIVNIKGRQDYLTQSKANQSYILNFSATWCGPCKAIGPVLAKK